MKFFSLSFLLILNVLFTMIKDFSCQDTTDTTTETTTNDATTTSDTAAGTTDTTETSASTSDTSNEDSYPVDITSLHCDDSKLSDFKKGEQVYLCVHILPKEYRMAFNVTVDEYEVLSITGGYIFSYKDTIQEQSYVMQLGNVTTPYKAIYFDKANSKVTTLFNLVIKLDKGKISDVVWDNDCWDCSFSNGCVDYNDITSLRNSSEVYSESVSVILSLL